MELISSYQNFPEQFKNCFLAIGNFDGVHVGHRQVLRKLVSAAKREGRPAGVMVFVPHPRAFFAPNVPIFYLTTVEERRRLFEGIGLDFICEVPFDKGFSNLTRDDFLDRILHEELNACHVFIGYNFFFGKGRTGNPSYLKERGEALPMAVSTIEPQGLDGFIVSSTSIREALMEGNIKAANQMLGRRWRAGGTVVHGAGRGHGLGFPTANVHLPPGCHLAHGIYATFVHLNGKRHQGAAYFGKRPSFDNGPVELEVFLLDFEGDLYGDHIAIEFVDFIRSDKKIDDIEALKAQMEEDCARARALLQGAT